MGQIQSIEEFISLLLRRRWLIIAITLLGMISAVAYAKSRGDIYEATAVIQVEVPTVVGTGGASSGQAPASVAAQMLQTIEQRLTTRDALSKVIERHGLFADAAALPQDTKLFTLRQAITFQAVDSAAGQGFGQARAISAIIIRAQWDTADMAARLANDFAQSTLDQSSSGQKERADENVAFFREEEARIWAEIAAVEAEVAAYKTENANVQPELQATRQDELVNLETELRRIDQDYVALQGQRDQINSKENKRETDRRQLADLDNQLAVMDAQIASIIAQRAEVEAALAASPEVEREIAAYDRKLRQLQDQTAAITQRLTEAETSQRLAERQQAERFTMLERAITPEYSLGGGRKKIAMAGSVAALIAGIVLAFLLDLLFPVVRTPAQMERQLDLLPVISIPEIRKPRGSVATLMQPFIDQPKEAVFMGIPRYAVMGAAAMVAVLLVAAVLG